MWWGRRLARTQFLPLFVQRCWRKVGITFGRLMRFSRCVSRKRKIPPMQHSDGFCRVKQRQNESGVLRGGKFFCGLSLTEVVGLTVITNHFLWLCSKWTRPHLVDEFEPIHKINGIYKKNTTACRMRQEVLKNLLKWSKKSMTHLVALGKNTLCESEQTPFSVCGRSFYCRQQQDVAFLTIV